MKTKKILSGLLALSALAACEPAFEPSLEVSPLAITVPVDGGSVQFTVTANEDWSAAADADWLTFEPASGTAADSPATVTVTVAAPNYQTSDKVAAITITSASLSQTVSVTWPSKAKVQDGTEANPYYILTADDLYNMRNRSVRGQTTYFVLAADIDMTGVEGYTPVNYGDIESVDGTDKTVYDRKIHFDGANHTISNFTCNYPKYPSIFGVLYGTVKDLNVTGATITSEATAAGILAGYAGTESGSTSLEAVVTNVKVNGTVTGAVVGVGGMAGFARCATFTNCEVDVTVTSSGTDVGGFVGKVVGTAAPNVFTGCRVKANVISSAPEKNRVGGLIGWNSAAETIITDCHVLEGTMITDKSAREKSSNGNFAGLIGFGDTTGSKVTIKNCTVNAAVSANSLATYNSLFVGCIGYASTTVVENCSVRGSLEGGNYTSGLFGAVQGDLTVSNSSCEADITSYGQRSGGLLGSVVTPANFTAPVKLTNCYYKGNIYAASQQVGGLVGFAQQALAITDCYAAGDVTSDLAGAGGLVGAINVAGSVVTNSIGWNKKITCNRADNTSWAPGAIIGSASQTGTYSKCIRRADLDFTDAAGAMTVVNQEDYINSYPEAPYIPAKNEYAQRAYHGKAAAEGKTLSAVAKDLGWSETVWDLSGEFPVLK